MNDLLEYSVRGAFAEDPSIKQQDSQFTKSITCDGGKLDDPKCLQGQHVSHREMAISDAGDRTV